MVCTITGTTPLLPRRVHSLQIEKVGRPWAPPKNCSTGGEEVLSSNTLGCLGAARETASTEAHQLPLLCLSVVVTLPCLEINIRLKLFINSRGWFLNCHVILCISIAMKFSSFDKLRIYKRDSPLSMSSLVWSLLGSC